MSHIARNRRKLLGRIRRIGGQVAGLENAVANETDCAKVLVQVAAVRGAVQGLMVELLEDHLREHLAAPDDPEQRADEVTAVAGFLRSYFK